MSLLTLLLLSLGLAADAFAVSIGRGLQMPRLRLRHVLALAGTLGLFQAAMPLAGWFLGDRLADVVSGVDHWLVFSLLVIIGVRMMIEAFQHDDDTDGAENGSAVASLAVLVVLGVATSIDAFAAGVGLAFVEVNIVLAVVLIGLVTFALCLVGVVVGHRVGKALRGPAEVFGGLVLIAIGTRLLLDHVGVW